MSSKIENRSKPDERNIKSVKDNKPEKPKLEIQVDSILQSNSGIKPDSVTDNDFTFKSSSGNTLEVESSSKTMQIGSEQVSILIVTKVS